MKATLTLNGKEYEVQLTDEQVIEIEKPKKMTGFERAELNGTYFSADSEGDFYEDSEDHATADAIKYENANYYSDVNLAEWCIRNDTLNRKMRRWAAEHNEEPIDWTNIFHKYHIIYDCDHKKFEIDYNCCFCYVSCCYFNSKKIAEAAIEEFGDEIKWLAENRPKWF